MSKVCTLSAGTVWHEVAANVFPGSTKIYLLGQTDCFQRGKFGDLLHSAGPFSRVFVRLWCALRGSERCVLRAFLSKLVTFLPLRCLWKEYIVFSWKGRDSGPRHRHNFLPCHVWNRFLCAQSPRACIFILSSGCWQYITLMPWLRIAVMLAVLYLKSFVDSSQCERKQASSHYLPLSHTHMHTYTQEHTRTQARTCTPAGVHIPTYIQVSYFALLASRQEAGLVSRHINLPFPLASAIAAKSLENERVRQ